MMLRFLLLALPLQSLAAAAEDGHDLSKFFEAYCVQCHGEDKQKGDVRLDIQPELDAELWEAVYEQLAGGEMPPDDEKQPEKTERNGVMKSVLLLAQEDSAIESTKFRRLNKREYANTVRDLLGLRSGTFDPGEYIYDEEIDEGFDTRAEALVISNELLLEYMNAAKKSLQHALFSSDTEKPTAQKIDVDLKKVSGTSRRYINNHHDHVIGRSGGKAKLFEGAQNRTMKFPGRYSITVTASGVDRDFYPVRFTPEKGPLVMGFGIMPDGMESLAGKGVLQKTFELKDDVEQTFQFDTWIDKDHLPYFSFMNGSSKPITQIRSNIRRRKIPASSMGELYRGPGIKITRFDIEGPFHDEWPPASFRATYDSESIPDLSNATQRKDLVSRFAKRAFRRPVADDEIAPYLAFMKEKHAGSQDWHGAVIDTFAAMMASIEFLYIQDDLAATRQGIANDSTLLGPHALANRLSYFLWSTMPDEELFTLADSGDILDPEILNGQVDRMLHDPRIKRFSDSFANQWLSLDSLGTMPPDTKDPQFKAYHRNKLEPAMLEETRRFFRYVLEENCSVRDFIDSDYSFINAGLAELYDVPFEGGADFVRTIFPADANRGGLLGQGSILTLTSNGVETSPVVRGHWVLDELLGTPPPPAPAEVPAIVPDLNGVETVRDLLEKHRSDVACMECHRRMDPLGFALESYDPIGRYREKYSPTQIVETDSFYKGHSFENVEGLKKIMLADVRPFARNLTIRIAEYAKGRKLGPSDFVAVEHIVDGLAGDEFPLRDIVSRIANGELLLNQ